MTSETRACRNCKRQFVIEPEDFDFYKKIEVPPPTFCPECRQQRRYAWRNERLLYRRGCDLCGKNTVIIYSPNKPYKVYCPPCWWSDKWSSLDYARDFDFSRPFFEQFKELQLVVPRIALLTKNSVNSEYTNHSNNNKNCYWCVSTFDSENILYGHNIFKNAKDCADCTYITEGGELLYECIDSERSYRCQYGMLLRDCTKCFYCYDCRGCSDCFLSSNLRNRQYYFLNQPLSKEEYEKKLDEFNLGSFQARRKLYRQYLEMMREKALHKFAFVEQSYNVSGNAITNSKNAHHVFDASRAEDSKYAIVCPDVKTTMDAYHYGFQTELVYECHALIHAYRTFFSHLCYDNSDISYCDSCHNSRNLFGCVGMKQSEYGIFNKRYSEAEYKDLRDKIIAHMKETKEYGEFFPASLSPFGYNETTWIVYMPLTRGEAIKSGFNWEDKVSGTYGKETISLEKMPDDIKNVNDSILGDILICEVCKKNFNVVRPELDFYRRENIPLPSECPNCRHARHVNLRPPRKLFDRQCACDYSVRENASKHGNHPDGRCPNTFKTPYAPSPAEERPEIVYCEECYQAEVS